MERDELLNSVFSFGLGDLLKKVDVVSEGGKYNVLFIPDKTQVESFADLIVSNPIEEDVQKFLQDNPQFLMSLFGVGDGTCLAFISKPKIGSISEEYYADFAILEYGQGGCYIYLIEIECPSDNIFNKDNADSIHLRTALKQINDWSAWVALNKQSYSRSLIEYTRKLPEFNMRGVMTSFRTQSVEFIEDAWRAFHGFDRPKIKYCVIIGMWSQLTAKQKEIMIYKNTEVSGNQPFVYTYEQVIRRSADRKSFGW